MTTFYLTKNDHRWVTFISLKATPAREPFMEGGLRSTATHVRDAFFDIAHLQISDSVQSQAVGLGIKGKLKNPVGGDYKPN